MKKEQEWALQDGFESDDEDKTDIITQQVDSIRDSKIELEGHMIKYVPPPQEIKNRVYSLHPDIITGWAPKIPMPKPVHLTFLNQSVSELLSLLSRDPKGANLAYLGPRFNNTYSAWRALGVQFPYLHFPQQRTVLTDRKFQGNNPKSSDNAIKFDSLFESGNLDAVFKVGDFQYDCFMRVDANTQGHLQWFYFKMSNLQKNVSYRINICNFQKVKTLYLRGMKPYVLSAMNLIYKNEGWTQKGQNIEYVKKPSKVYLSLTENDNEDKNQQKFYTLSFSISTEHQNDTLSLAYCPPYTFTKLKQFLVETMQKHKIRDIINDQQLCYSLGGFKIPLLTITNSVTECLLQFKNNKSFGNRRLVFVTGRIHPGQCNGSYMMEGFIRWLCGNTVQSQQLRNRYIFKIVPMVNPDGVVMGNYRAGLSGKDFNREFTSPDSRWFVEISSLKSYLQRCKWIYQKKFQLFLDLHGHTVKKNVFTYGPQFSLTNSKYYECRLFPKLLSKKTQFFRYYSCVFKVSASKVATARAVLLRQFGIPFAYTVEASNGSYYHQLSQEDRAFDPQKWQQMGAKLCQALFDYWVLVKDVEQQKARRKRQKNQRQKAKIEKTRRIQSSSQKVHPKNGVSFKSKQYLNDKIQKQSPFSKKNQLFNDILNELTQPQIEQVKCSDDELSEGKSDSQNADDDIDPITLRNILTAQIKPVKKIDLIRNAQQKKGKQSKLLTIVKKTSFVTDFDDDEGEKEKRNSPIEKRRKQALIRKKLFTVNGLQTPSPTKEPDNTSAKIINLSFILNPLPVANTIINLGERRHRQQTQHGVWQQQKETRQAGRQAFDSYRKTYLSLQKQTLKKEMIRRITIYDRPMRSSFKSFKMQEVVGKRIFTQT